MRLATLNVNSARRRVPHVQRFLQSAQPDLLFLQELKCKAEEFPAAEFEPLGYRAHAVGQSGGRNGVAVLSRIPFQVVAEALPGEEEDTQARYIEIAAAGGRFAGIYLPNGNSGGPEGYAYKLRWMERLRQVAADRLDSFTPFAILGDFNVCPTPLDLAPGALPATDALVRPESRAAFRALINLGLTDALRALHPRERLYTYWDYGAAFDANRGLRIDHALLSSDLAERLEKAEIDLSLRSMEQPSDHTAVTITLR
ncbi:exodeoxyribonuclease III [Roseomonas marmotae]|uniref:Exodeoxyribonuclease III n=1 Tax=Roseomonas marmotae TaxID=2768161 RepID=A0ABS3KCS1_9PROT|nr:exodeoxyribonuclease III [Roseomonas marmotae]MBO1075262.1 exodeoxyribonuclease III [Roseomonas marmotae]QTI78247.1 exodeoxyribonuclease III [Roseomonas marmotae]